MNIYKKISTKIRTLNSALNNAQLSDVKFDDLYGLQLINSLIQNWGYTPFSQMAMRPFCLSYIMNDLIINHRNNIIEFGSGISTLLLSRLIKTNNLDAKFVSIESDLNWIKHLTSILEKDDTSQFVKLIHAPLSTIAEAPCKWYDPETIEKAIFGDEEFDLVIVDGPPAYNSALAMSRQPALPFIFPKISDRCSIFLDDCDRVGEKEILTLWEKEFNLEFIIYSSSLGVAVRGDSYVSIPSRYANSKRL